jgi:glycosyltransferase involved in cell wall biosynthesis
MWPTACCCPGPPRDVLYVVLPYFNYCGFKRRQELFIKFVHEIQHVKGVRIVVSELVGPAPLPKLSVWKHVKNRSDSPVWMKEKLINVGIKNLPDEWKYVAWIDADITFLNPNWVQDTIEALQTNDIVQMFRTAVNLGPNNEAIKVDKGFGYMHAGSGTPYIKTDKYGYWHPGYAWACTRSAFRGMGSSLLDWAILGSGDRHMAMAWIGRVLDSCPGTVHMSYKVMLMEYQYKCKNFSISYVPGTILHHWHGRFEDRKYKERWNVLVQHAFNPIEDITMSLNLTPSGKRMEQDLKAYFEGRREDSM